MSSFYRKELFVTFELLHENHNTWYDINFCLFFYVSVSIIVCLFAFFVCLNFCLYKYRCSMHSLSLLLLR